MRLNYGRDTSGVGKEDTISQKIRYKYIGEIERGEVNPSLKSIVEVAAALGVNIQSLFPTEEDILPNISHKELKTIKEAITILNKTFEKI